MSQVVHKNSHCCHCGVPCAVLNDPIFGSVSDCHGCGISYETSEGEIVYENEDLRPISEWSN